MYELDDFPYIIDDVIKLLKVPYDKVIAINGSVPVRLEAKYTVLLKNLKEIAIRVMSMDKELKVKADELDKRKFYHYTFKIKILFTTPSGDKRVTLETSTKTTYVLSKEDRENFAKKEAMDGTKNSDAWKGYVFKSCTYTYEMK